MTNLDIQLRVLEPESLPDICRLWDAAATFDRCTAAILSEKIFADAAVLSSLRTGAFLNNELVGFAVGAVNQHRGFVKLIGVHPDRQRAGVGTSLVAHIESALRQAGATSVRLGESAPNYLTPGIDQRNKAAVALFQRLGYQSIGTTSNQSVDLTAKDWDSTTAERELARQHGVTVVRATPLDRVDIEALLQHEWPSWQTEVWQALSNEPPTLHVAKHHESLVAFAAFDANNVGTGWFGPMGTLPDYNSRGIGRILLWRCLADMQQDGHLQATIPWVGPLGFYEQHAGATLSRQFERMEKTL